MTARSFKKVSKANLADTIGDLGAQIKLLEADLKAAKAEAKARGINEAAGDLYAIKVSDGWTVTLDKQAVIAKLGQQWVDDNSRTTHWEKVTATALKSALIDKMEEAA